MQIANWLKKEDTKKWSSSEWILGIKKKCLDRQEDDNGLKFMENNNFRYDMVLTKLYNCDLYLVYTAFYFDYTMLNNSRQQLKGKNW